MILNAIPRGFQLLFSIVVLGLSVTLAKYQQLGSVPAQTGYAAFTGALGIVVALVGIASLLFQSLSGVITLVLDGVSAVALLVGGIVYAVATKGLDCSSFSHDNSFYGDNWQYAVLSGGCAGPCSDNSDYWYAALVQAGLDDASTISSHCRSAEADCAFMFLAFLATSAALVFSMVTRNR